MVQPGDVPKDLADRLVGLSTLVDKLLGVKADDCADPGRGRLVGRGLLGGGRMLASVDPPGRPVGRAVGFQLGEASPLLVGWQAGQFFERPQPQMRGLTIPKLLLDILDDPAEDRPIAGPAF